MLRAIQQIGRGRQLLGALYSLKGITYRSLTNTVTLERQIGLFPERCDESFAAHCAFEFGASKRAELGEIFWAEVRHLVLLPMRPQVLDRIEFGRVGRQKFQLDVAALCIDVIAHQPAAMSLQPIPDDEQLAGGEMARETLEEGDALGRADGAFDELEVDVPEGDARHGRELVPGEAVLQDRGLASGRPGSHAVGPFAHSGLVDEDDRSALFGAVFFSAGQRFFFQCWTAFSSRWVARPLGRWQEKFKALSSRHAPDSEYRLPLIFSISLPTRESVHRSAAYPCAKAPASSAAIKRFFCASVSRGGRPVRGAWCSASRRFDRSACCQRQTEVRLTLSRRATSAGFTPRCSRRAPCKRRASSSARSRCLLMPASPPSKIYGKDVGVVTLFVKDQ